MLRDDPCRDAFKVAVEPTLARIQRDRARAPRVLKKVFTVVAGKLFHPSLNATEAWRAAGIRDRAMGAVFKNFTATSLGRYIAAARIEVANVLMVITDLDLASISERVGYTYHPTFTENFKRLKGKLPSEVARVPPAPPLIDDAREDWLREKSRWEGRKSRRRGIELAKLALLSLDGRPLDAGRNHLVTSSR